MRCLDAGCGAGVSLTALAEAAQQLGATGEQTSSLLLSQAAKAGGVPCAPAQLYFLALEQVRKNVFLH